MSTTDAGGSGRQGQQGRLGRVRWPVMLVLLASAMTGCSGGEAQPRNGSPDLTAPTHGTDTPLPQHKLDKLAGFLDKTKFLDRVGPKFELRAVTYTSPSDAVAEFLDNRVGADEWGRVIATTDDNWAHASRLFINDDLADLVYYVPLGRGAVAIKARDQLRGKSYPPFVLYPDGTVKPMRIAEPRALDADSELLKSHRGFLIEIGAEELTGYKIGGREPTGLWAADVDAGEIFQLVGSPFGQVLEHVPGRDGEIVSVAGYRRNVGDGVWRFETSTDAGQSWRRTDIRLPLGRRPIWRYADNALHAVGPGHLQAIAMADYLQDAPMLLRELWLTDDEQEFRRVPLPWDRTLFGGVAFASDGALLLSEVTGPVTYCDALACNRAGRIWRLAPGGTEMKRLPSAPRLFGPFWAVGIDFSGGSIIARTGLRSIALSVDGYTWTKVTPG